MPTRWEAGAAGAGVASAKGGASGMPPP
jgi:hypothetical protein